MSRNARLGVCRNRPTGTEDGRATEVKHENICSLFLHQGKPDRVSGRRRCRSSYGKSCLRALQGLVFKTTGKNAFRPTTKLSDEDRKWYEDHNRIKHFDATLKQNGEK